MLKKNTTLLLEIQLRSICVLPRVFLPLVSSSSPLVKMDYFIKRKELILLKLLFKSNKYNN